MDGTNLDKRDLNESDDHMQLPVQSKGRKNEHRSELSQMSKSSSGASDILTSCQTCDAKVDLLILNKHIQKISSNPVKMTDDILSLLNHLKGLRAIWQILTATVPEVTGCERRISYMDFEEAFSLYSGYSTQGHDSSDLKN